MLHRKKLKQGQANLRIMKNYSPAKQSAKDIKGGSVFHEYACKTMHRRRHAPSFCRSGHGRSFPI